MTLSPFSWIRRKVTEAVFSGLQDAVNAIQAVSDDPPPSHADLLSLASLQLPMARTKPAPAHVPALTAQPATPSRGPKARAEANVEPVAQPAVDQHLQQEAKSVETKPVEAKPVEQPAPALAEQPAPAPSAEQEQATPTSEPAVEQQPAPVPGGEQDQHSVSDPVSGSYPATGNGRGRRKANATSTAA